MKEFNLKTFLTANKQEVLNQFEVLKNEKFYNNISLKEFMIEVMCYMKPVKSEAKALTQFPNAISYVAFENSKLGAVIYSTPYSESNQAKKVNFFGKEKATQLNNI